MLTATALTAELGPDLFAVTLDVGCRQTLERRTGCARSSVKWVKASSRAVENGQTFGFQQWPLLHATAEQLVCCCKVGNDEPDHSVQLQAREAEKCD